jgi:xanthine dehydrogenase large subunit
VRTPSSAVCRCRPRATGTPDIDFDYASWRGNPFFYFAYGAAVAEVAVDVLTGESRLLRADLLHDVGHSLNPAIDRGQIEGGFIQGMGWLTMEEVVWDAKGRLLTHAPSTYKIPVAGDCPPKFNVWLWEKGRNERDIAYRSKAVGEPPLMLARLYFMQFTTRSGPPARRAIRCRWRRRQPENVLRAIHAIHRSRV